MQITSLQNSYVKTWASLKQKKNRDILKQFFVEGEHLVRAALEHHKVVTLIYVGEKPEYFPSSLETYEVSYSVMEKISTTNTPQKVAAICSYFMEETMSTSYRRIVALDGVQDPGNGGTIVRTALAFGIDALIMSEDSFDLYNDKFIRATQGAIFDLPIFRLPLVIKLEECQRIGYDILVTSLETDSISYLEYHPKERFILVLGSEGQGVSMELMHLASVKVNIPIAKEIESLNVAVAGAILMARYMMEK